MEPTLQQWQSVLESRPADPEVLTRLLLLLDQGPDSKLRLEYSERLVKALPNQAFAHALRARACRTAAMYPEALQCIQIALRISNRDLLSNLELAHLHQVHGNIDECAKIRRACLREAEKIGLEKLPAMVLADINAASAWLGQRDWAAIDQLLSRHEAAEGAPAIARIRKAAEISCGLTPFEPAHPDWNPALMYIPGMQPRPWFEANEFSWRSMIEDAQETIRAELLEVLPEMTGFTPYVETRPGDPKREYWKELDQSKSWSAFHFYRHGKRYDQNCQRCPRTAAILDKLPLMAIPGYGPEAMFSVLAPHTRIPAHVGSVNGRLICHLPLIVPEDCGQLKVGGEARDWHEGKLMVFDDAMLHEAWNHSDHVRVVLIFDTWNPQLSAAERTAFSEVLQLLARLGVSMRKSAG